MTLIDDNDDSASSTCMAESISTEICSSTFPSMSDCATAAHISDDDDHDVEKRTALLFNNNNAENESYPISSYSEQITPKQYCKLTIMEIIRTLS